jgi:hypothetical protein
VSEQDAAKLSIGQQASLVLDGAQNVITGSLASLAASSGASGRVAQVRVDWGSTELPKVGRTAQVTLTLQHKDNVLLIPKKAVRTAGARQYVQFLSGTTRRVANIELGIATDTDVEVTSGLTEGQIIVVGP